METEGNNIRDLDEKELATLARRYYAERFPNPQRLSCPPPGEIIKVVISRQVPDEALREHLFECSECFGEYRQALAQSRPAPNEAAWRNRLVLIFASMRSATSPAPVILILSSLSLIFIGILLVRNIASEAGQVASSTPSDAGAGGTGLAASDQGPGAKATISRPVGKGRGIVGALEIFGSSAPGARALVGDFGNYHSVP